MREWRQLLALLRMNLGNFEGRVGPFIVTLIGTACVVGVLVSMLSMGAGVRREAHIGVSPSRAVVETGKQWIGGGISTQNAAIIESEPGIRRDPQGRPMASGGVVTVIRSRKKSDGSSITAPVAGVQPEWLREMPELKLTAGRMFRPGLHELIVGKMRYLEDRGMAVGDRVWVRGDEWTIVGHFDVPGLTDSLLLTDAATLMSTTHANSYYNILVTVDPAGGFARLQRALQADPALHVVLRHEADANADSVKPIMRLLDFVSYFVGAVMAAGATVGAINALYALVDHRRREMATLLAIGFSGGPIVLAVLIESMLMALPGAVLGALAAWLLFNGHHISPTGLSFSLSVTPQLALFGIAWALAMGLLGGLMPALRSARVPVTEALRTA